METHLKTKPDGKLVLFDQEVWKTYLFVEAVQITQEEAEDKSGFDAKPKKTAL